MRRMHSCVSFACAFLVLSVSGLVVAANLQPQEVDLHENQFFPDHIPRYEVRRDKYTNETVSRGRLHLVNYKVSEGTSIPPNNEAQKSKMVDFDSFQRNLQCASPKPELDGTRGGWTMIQMAPPKRQTIEQVCAWAESKCESWEECRKKVKKFKKGDYDLSISGMDQVWGRFRTALLLRVIDNELYYDWPWGMERFKSQEDYYSGLLTDHLELIEIVLRIVRDIGDSVFLFGGERPFLRWNIPFPMFSFAPSLSYADFPFPWIESYDAEMNKYVDSERAQNNFTDALYQRDDTPWHNRIPKAAFFSSFTPYRQLVYDSAVLRPDLLDVSYMFTPGMEPWNPLSDEPKMGNNVTEEREIVKETYSPERNHSGYLQPIVRFADGRHYTPTQFKYVIVPTGSSDLSSSGRLAGLLAHSGAVVLLQKSEFAYHFSARLQPWVHYVPLSHSMSDVIDKVEWLKRNDHLARRIVRNAQNFALSYLRLEDYLCYAAGSLRLIHEVEKTTDVLEGFSPVKIKRVGK